MRLVLVLMLAILSGPAVAHKAASGWTYEAICCSVRDCHEAAPGEVENTDAGYLIPATRELIPYTDKRVKPSGDGVLHRCSRAGLITGETICLYVPGSS